MPPIWILQMRLAEAAVLAGGLHGGGGLDRVAKRLDRDARRRRDVLVGTVRCGGFGRCAGMSCVPDHFPTSLILAVVRDRIGGRRSVSPLRYLSRA